MQKTTFHPLVKQFRHVLVILSGILLLTGCGDEPREEKDKDDKKPAYERVVILKERFNQLESSLDEMERDLEIQRKRIEKTRETAKAIKRSLLKGNLKGYSLDTISTDPIVIAAIQKKKDKDQKAEADEAEEEESENFVLNTLLMIFFAIFIIVIFVVVLRDRNQTPYDLSQVKPEPPRADDIPAPTIKDELTPNVDTSGSTYGDLGPRENPIDNPEMPPTGDEPGPEEPRQ